MVQTRLKVGGYEAWVVVEKEKVEHYDIDVDEEANVATCWIASTAGKRFGVWVGKRCSNFNCVVDLYLDGSNVEGDFLLKYDKEPILTDEVQVGEHSFRPFLFGALNLTEDESFLNTQLCEKVGTIKVEVQRISRYKWRRRARLPVRDRDTHKDAKVHERAKKSATHHVLFGEKKTVPGGSSDHGGVSTYRPKEIISDPEDEEDKRKEAQLEAELENVRKARLARQQAKHASKKVKREPKPVFLPGEIIDLTI